MVVDAARVCRGYFLRGCHKTAARCGLVTASKTVRQVVESEGAELSDRAVGHEY